jgi:glutamate dehydrogenase/leucine dehydrogenase
VIQNCQRLRKLHGAGSGKGDIDLRTAAYVLAIGRVADAAVARGIWP